MSVCIQYRLTHDERAEVVAIRDHLQNLEYFCSPFRRLEGYHKLGMRKEILLMNSPRMTFSPTDSRSKSCTVRMYDCLTCENPHAAVLISGDSEDVDANVVPVERPGRFGPRGAGAQDAG